MAYCYPNFMIKKIEIVLKVAKQKMSDCCFSLTNDKVLKYVLCQKIKNLDFFSILINFISAGGRLRMHPLNKCPYSCKTKEAFAVCFSDFFLKSWGNKSLKVMFSFPYQNKKNLNVTQLIEQIRYTDPSVLTKSCHRNRNCK